MLATNWLARYVYSTSEKGLSKAISRQRRRYQVILEYSHIKKYLITKVHVTLCITTDDIEEVRKEIASHFGVETKYVHLNHEEIKEENKEE